MNVSPRRVDLTPTAPTPSERSAVTVTTDTYSKASLCASVGALYTNYLISVRVY